MGNGKNNKNKRNRNKLQARRRQAGKPAVSAVVGAIHRDLQLTSQIVKTRIFQNPNAYTVEQVNAACGAAVNDVTTALAAIDQAVISLGTVIAQAAAAATDATVAPDTATPDAGNTTT